MKDQAAQCRGCPAGRVLKKCIEQRCPCEEKGPGLSASEYLRRHWVGVQMHFSEWEFDKLLRGE